MDTLEIENTTIHVEKNATRENGKIVWGTQHGQFHLVGPGDLYYDEGFTISEFKELGPAAAKSQFLSPTAL